MIKIFKYLKKYWIALLVIVALLYIQAQTVLALPDYMSKIVTYGITTGGIESSTPEVMNKETMDHISIFMKDKDFEEVKKSYTYLPYNEIKSNNTNYKLDKDKVSKDGGVYVLKDLSDKKLDELEKKVQLPNLMVFGMNMAMSGEQSIGGSSQSKEYEQLFAQMPQGMNVFDYLAQMPDEVIEKMMKQSEKTFESSGESAITMASSTAVKAEYEALGINMDSIQTNYILQAGVKMLGIALLGGIASITVAFLSSLIAAKTGRDMRRDVFEKVESFSSTEINKFSTASLITRTTNDVQQIQQSLVMILRIVIYSPILAFGAVVKVMNTSGAMLTIIVCVVAILMVIIGLTFAGLNPNFKKSQKILDKINLVMRENLNGMLVIRAFHNEGIEEERFDEVNKESRRINLLIGRIFSSLMPIVMFIMNGVMVLIIWVGAHEVDAGTMQIGDMMAFMQYAMQIIMSFIMVAMVAIMLSRSSVAAKRIFEVLNTKLSIDDPKQSLAFNEDKQGLVEFKDVSFRYPGAEEDVLSNITFTAKPKQTTAFIGSTGSGKSTIINLVPRFFDVTGGEVLVDGVNIKDVPQKDLRDKIGFVPQKGELFSGTIASNIKYSDENMSDERMIKAAEVAQATEFINAKEEGYDTPISQGGTNVSGGQKQRLSIARAIAKQPEIFIFDDSFSALDFKTDSKLREALNELVQESGSSVLLVAQRISSIMHADQIVVLDEGKIVGIGKHKELLKTCEVYKEIAYSQLSKEELEDE